MVKLEITSGQMQGDYNIKCPRCGSTKVHVDKKGFDYGDACCGAALFGPLGLLCGGMESNKLMATCMNCGKKFDAESLKRQWKEQQREEAEKEEKHKTKKPRKRASKKKK
jgi:tellurium resistance protein TerD